MNNKNAVHPWTLAGVLLERTGRAIACSVPCALLVAVGLIAEKLSAFSTQFHIAWLTTGLGVVSDLAWILLVPAFCAFMGAIAHVAAILQTSGAGIINTVAYYENHPNGKNMAESPRVDDENEAGGQN